MLKAFAVRCLVATGILISCAMVSLADDWERDWARAMIDKDLLNINYKSVAKGQDVYFRIRVSNIYKEEMQVIGLSTSCGCLSFDESKVAANGLLIPILIPSGTEKTLTLRLDTVRHSGEKKNTKAIITFFEPSKGEKGTATIIAEGYIRSDVVIQPGSVNFGSVAPHQGAEQRIMLNYAGRNDWNLASVKFNNPHLSADVHEKSRGNGLVNYELVVKLKDSAPEGLLRDQMLLVTDDANNPTIPVQVEAKIEPEISVTEANFGTLTPGKPKEVQILVRYTKLPVKPFKIEKFERTKPDNTIKVKKSDDMKTLHQMTLTFTPPNEPGLFEEEFFLTISGRTEPIIFKARGRILDTPPVADPDVKK